MSSANDANSPFPVSIPGYTILGVLGSGGMGAVYKAHQERLDRIVAIKVLARHLGDDPAFKARFETEAKAIAKLVHPNVVGIYDSGETADGQLYFIMEFVEGTNAFHFLQMNGPVEIKQLIGMLAPVCEAIATAHTNGIIHRDLKPGNLLIGLDGRAKVADFGLATLGSLSPEEIYGTPGYAAPEMYEGQGDHRVDIFALGAMLFQLASGRTPEIIQQAQIPHGTIADRRLANVIAKAMQPAQEARYQSAADMKADLLRIVQPEPAPAQRIPVASKVPVRRPPVVAGAQTPFPVRKKSSGMGFLIALLAIAGIGGGAYYLIANRTPPVVVTEPPPVEDPAPPPPPKEKTPLMEGSALMQFPRLRGTPGVWNDDLTVAGFEKSASLELPLNPAADTVALKLVGTFPGAITVSFTDVQGESVEFTYSGGETPTAAWNLTSSGSAKAALTGPTTIDLIVLQNDLEAYVNGGKVIARRSAPAPFQSVKVTGEPGVQLNVLSCWAADGGAGSEWLEKTQAEREMPVDPVAQSHLNLLKTIADAPTTLLHASMPVIEALATQLAPLKLDFQNPVKAAAERARDVSSGLIAAFEARRTGKGFEALQGKAGCLVSSTGHAFILVDSGEPISRLEAEKTASRWKGHLPVITSKEERNDVQAYLLRMRDEGKPVAVWLGAVPLGGTWTWITGEAFPAVADLPPANPGAELALVPAPNDTFEWKSPSAQDSTRVLIEFPAPDTKYPRSIDGNAALANFLSEMRTLWKTKRAQGALRDIDNLGPSYLGALKTASQTATPREISAYSDETDYFNQNGEVPESDQGDEPAKLLSLRSTYRTKRAEFERAAAAEIESFLSLVSQSGEAQLTNLRRAKSSEEASFENWLRSLPPGDTLSPDDVSALLDGESSSEESDSEDGSTEGSPAMDSGV